MPIELRLDVRLFTLHEAASWLDSRGVRMPGGSQITYPLFMNYFKSLRRRGLRALRVGRAWVIPESELDDLERLWRKIAE